ncbi:LysR family transcriptional regulator [Companilactobacillus sp.]|jgi:DNA-binding transcriptional LysR family regulator|uniref:LysR family transcriptional regulator n=1 Tax=Companilactobacillus sp. TaxID=2767905 RepID=UPI0025C6B5BB|nr:LysR family transcriptional regulator [Companilactobacillus sp.]MCH4009171.1 LysR family transcriptional regulator [Companilactobacillus sp.]MCH4050650.1 LysR family transcriptional regulator [Companilactobacillus sp.]MCH4077113.1 LysR family transcriptional regulator [Companilactobacillus sp.]MCH4125689.1 LysR family transcriptional regulator [Companilactobacillus sp.]MCI1311398.1 LysR family transcriptional regulator [Companilactobacillus sp.]
MNLDHLRYFVALSSTENYTQTAKMLHITQPSLTKAIHSLESELSVQLFQKTGRGVTLTPAGRLFANSAASSLISLNKSIAQVKNFNQQKTIIRLASIRTLSIKWIPEIAQRFLQYTANPSVNFQFNTDTGLSPDILNGLRSKKYDVAFCSRLDEYNDIDFFPVAEQTLVCITPINHPLANRSSVNLKETLAYPQVTFSERSGLHSILGKLFDDVGGKPISAYSVEEDQTIAGLVANNFGIAVVPNMSILQTLPVKIIPLSYPKWHRILYMATLKQNQFQPETDNFVKFVREQSEQITINNI